MTDGLQVFSILSVHDKLINLPGTGSRLKVLTLQMREALRSGFEDDIEGRLSGAADAGEAGVFQDFREARFASLRAER